MIIEEVAKYKLNVDNVTSFLIDSYKKLATDPTNILWEQFFNKCVDCVTHCFSVWIEQNTNNNINKERLLFKHILEVYL